MAAAGGAAAAADCAVSSERVADADGVDLVHAGLPFIVVPDGTPTLAIVQAGDPVLRAPAATVTVEYIRSDACRALVASMIATMRAAPGVGIAAPQVGVGIRAFVAEDAPHLIAKDALAGRKARVPFGTLVVFNPVVEAVAGDGTAEFYEGCLSVAGWAGAVQRARHVVVRGLDAAGDAVAYHAVDWPARILQHEADHLAGTLYVDRMDTRSFCSRAHLDAAAAAAAAAGRDGGGH